MFYKNHGACVRGRVRSASQKQCVRSVSNRTIRWTRRGMRRAVTPRIMNSANKYTLGVAVRMKQFSPARNDWSYRLCVKERWTCIHQSTRRVKGAVSGPVAPLHTPVSPVSFYD